MTVVSQKELANNLGVTVQTIINYEKNNLIKRLPAVGAKYNLEECREKILGDSYTNNLTIRRLLKENQELKVELLQYRRIIETIHKTTEIKGIKNE